MPLQSPFTNDKDPKEIGKRIVVSADLKVNRLFIDGDHYQGGDGWIGPRPQQGEEGEQDTWAEIERAFTSANKIAEVCERHSDGTIGREPRFSLTPREPVPDGEEMDDTDKEAIATAEAALTQWWNRRQVHQHALDAVTTLMWAERSPVRIYVPAAVLEQGDKFETIEEALEAVYVEALAPENAAVYVDPATKLELGIVTYKTVDGDDVTEIVFVADSGETIVRQIKGETVTDYPQQFGGRITMHEMLRKRFITPQIRQNQKALNLALSTIPRNVTTAGFLERILLNAQLPGRWETNPDGTRKRFVPEKFQTGAGTTQFVVGIEQTDRNGNITNARPEAVFREPVDPQGSIDSAAEHYARILEEADQLHVLITGDATASGRSRVEARSDFVASLRRTVPSVESFGRWMIETALAVAEALLNKPGEYTEKYRAEFNCRLSTGVITPEEREQNRKEVEAGLMPHEYAMSENGIDDVDAAMALIEARPELQLTVMQKRAAVLRELTAAGATLEQAARIAGFSDEDVAILKEAVDPSQQQVRPTGDDDPDAAIDDADPDDDAQE